MKTVCVVMAGGEGTRFWPLSRAKKPKQLLNLSGKDIMIDETIKRFKGIVDDKDIFIITNCSQKEEIVNCSRLKLYDYNFIIEPFGKNTAPAIGYAALSLIKKFGDCLMIVVPSDSYIENNDAFQKVVGSALEFAKKKSAGVTIGIKPTYPSTGYGYIKYDVNDTSDIKKALRFVEKPNKEIANDYFVSKEYYWNSGMFIWKASFIAGKIKKHLPLLFEQLTRIVFNEEEAAKIYSQIDSISIDYGIMEKADDIFVVEGSFYWNDLGTWDSVGAIFSSDDENNIFIGDVVPLDTKNSTIFSKDKTVVSYGVDNLLVVQVDDVIMVCNKDKTQDIKKIIAKLKELGRTNLL